MALCPPVPPQYSPNRPPPRGSTPSPKQQLRKTFVLSYNQGLWNIQVAVIEAESPQMIAQRLGGSLYFELDNHARIKFPKEIFVGLPLRPETIAHVLQAEKTAPRGFPGTQDEIRLRLAETPILIFS